MTRFVKGNTNSTSWLYYCKKSQSFTRLLQGNSKVWLDKSKEIENFDYIIARKPKSLLQGNQIFWLDNWKEPKRVWLDNCKDIPKFGLDDCKKICILTRLLQGRKNLAR